MPEARKSNAVQQTGPGRLDRRGFLQGVSVAMASAAMVDVSVVDVAAAEPPGAGQVIAGKDARLLVHTAEPAVLETPSALLLEQRLTPANLLFVRNNQMPAGAATIKPLPLAGWKVELSGLVNSLPPIDAEMLTRLEQTEVEMVLQCSGNSRVLFAETVKAKGTPWGRGGMGNVRFGGVTLAKVLQHLGARPRPEARFLTAAGADEPAQGEQDFEHSLPLDEALKKSVLALRLNGEPLAAIHGGPVRLVIPGYFGTMHVKWLNQLRFETKESNHTSQIPHYRTPLEPIAPGTAFEATYDNSEPNWRMKIKSVVLSPTPGAKTGSQVSVAGVAFNDGEAPIERVLVSSDAGKTWQAADFARPESPYAWCVWRTELKLPAGKHSIWSMAVDALGRSQPLDGSIGWNPSGYTWNGVEKISIQVS